VRSAASGSDSFVRTLPLPSEVIDVLRIEPPDLFPVLLATGNPVRGAAGSTHPGARNAARLIGAITMLLMLVVSVMMKTMVDAGAGASTRLRAADLVYSHALKAIEIEDMDARLSDVERALEQMKSSEK
jgi:hypothetical protein